ncbi:hypothetical protein CRUP_030425, partial [Coryphaenoides rupestris]
MVNDDDGDGDDDDDDNNSTSCPSPRPPALIKLHRPIPNNLRHHRLHHHLRHPSYASEPFPVLSSFSRDDGRRLAWPGLLPLLLPAAATAVAGDCPTRADAGVDGEAGDGGHADQVGLDAGLAARVDAARQAGGAYHRGGGHRADALHLALQEV